MIAGNCFFFESIFFHDRRVSSLQKVDCIETCAQNSSRSRNIHVNYICYSCAVWPWKEQSVAACHNMSLEKARVTYFSSWRSRGAGWSSCARWNLLYSDDSNSWVAFFRKRKNTICFLSPPSHRRLPLQTCVYIFTWCLTCKWLWPVSVHTHFLSFHRGLSFLIHIHSLQGRRVLPAIYRCIVLALVHSLKDLWPQCIKKQNRKWEVKARICLFFVFLPHMRNAFEFCHLSQKHRMWHTNCWVSCPPWQFRHWLLSSKSSWILSSFQVSKTSSTCGAPLFQPEIFVEEKVRFRHKV